MSLIDHNDPLWRELSNSVTSGDKNNILKIIDKVGINRLFSGMNTPQTILSKVIQYGSSFGNNQTSRKEYVDFVRLLLTKGACVHYSGDVTHDSRTPMHLRDPHTKIFSALYWAVYNKYYDILKLFVEFKVDFRRNDSILHYLILNPTETYYEIFKLLVLNGANINCKVYIGKLYPTLLDLYNSYYVTGKCNENEVAKKIKKILECGIQHVIEIEAKKQKEAEIEMQKQIEIEKKRQQDTELQQKKTNYEKFLVNKLQKICDNIKTFEMNYSELINQFQNSTNGNEIISSNILNLSKSISHSSELLEQFNIHKSETENEIKLDEIKLDEIKFSEIKLNEIEKMSFDQKTLYFNEMEEKINVDKQKVLEQKIWISNALININIQIEKNIKEENKTSKMDIIKSTDIIKSEKFVKLRNESINLSGLISTLANDSNSHIIPDTLKQNVRTTNYIISQNYDIVDRFKNDIQCNTFDKTIQNKFEILKHIENQNNIKYENLLKQKNEFTQKGYSTIPQFHQILEKIEETTQNLESKLEEIKKNRLYDKIEAGTYIKLALDQIQSISSYSDAIPPNLKEFYGKNIVHLLIQAKHKMPPNILKELIPKLPENFHPYLTSNETKFDDVIPPWKN